MKPIRSNPLHQYRLLLGVLAILTFTASANAWWDGDWTLRKKIVIDATSAGVAIDAPIGTAPLLFRLSDGDFQFQAAKEDGSDIRFVAADEKTLLPYHIEKFDSLMSEAFVWVKVPDIKPGGQTIIWMYYGNSGQKATNVTDVKGTYDTDTTLVYHFAEHNAPFADASGHTNATKAAGVTVDALIGDGMRLNGKLPVTIPATTSLQVFAGGSLTWQAWIKPTTLAANSVLLSRHDGSGSLVIGMDNAIPFVEVGGANGTLRTTVAAPVTVNTWHHLAVVATGGKVTLYLDGDAYGADQRFAARAQYRHPPGQQCPGGHAPRFHRRRGRDADGEGRATGWLREIRVREPGRERCGGQTGHHRPG